MSSSEWLPLSEDHQPTVGSDIEVCRYYVDEHSWWHRTWFQRGVAYLLEDRTDLSLPERYGVNPIDVVRVDDIDDKELEGFGLPEPPDTPGDHIFWRPYRGR